VRPPTRRPRAARVLKALAALAGLAALVVAGFAAASVDGDLGRLVAELRDERTGLLVAATGGAAVLALLLLAAARLARGRAARRRAAVLAEEGRRALAAVVDRCLVAPTVAVLEDHRAVREAAALATEPVVRPASRGGSTRPEPAASSPD